MIPYRGGAWKYLRYYFSIHLIRYGYYSMPEGPPKTLLAVTLKQYYDVVKLFRHKI